MFVKNQFFKINIRKSPTSLNKSTSLNLGAEPPGNGAGQRQLFLMFYCVVNCDRRFVRFAPAATFAGAVETLVITVRCSLPERGANRSGKDHLTVMTNVSTAPAKVDAGVKRAKRRSIET